MNKLDREARARILHLLCEGSSIRAITRLTGASKNTVIKLVVDAGKAASWYQDRVFHNLTCKRVQVDEIWNFVYAKQKNVPTAKAAPANAGDVWTWTAIDADTKLMPSWFVGGRDSDCAMIFMDDLASRLANRVQLTSDGHRAYLEAVEGAFGADVDYAQLVKLYGATSESAKGRYSPAECIGARKERDRRQSRPEAHQHVVFRALQSHDADAHAALHAADQCLLKEGREPRACGRPSHDVLQFRPRSSDAAHDACDGGRRDQATLGNVGRCGSTGSVGKPATIKLTHYHRSRETQRRKRLEWRQCDQ